MLLWDNSIYVWYKLTRVTGKVGKFKFASMKCDAVATGVFSDSVERLTTITVNARTCKEKAFKLYKEALVEAALKEGYTINRVFAITRKEYKAMLNDWLQKIEELDEQFNAPAYTGERMIRK